MSHLQQLDDFDFKTNEYGQIEFPPEFEQEITNDDAQSAPRQIVMSEKLAEKVNHEDTIKLLKELSLLSYLQESDDDDIEHQRRKRIDEVAKTEIQLTQRQQAAWQTGYDGFGNKQQSLRGPSPKRSSPVPAKRASTKATKFDKAETVVKLSSAPTINELNSSNATERLNETAQQLVPKEEEPLASVVRQKPATQAIQVSAQPQTQNKVTTKVIEPTAFKNQSPEPKVSVKQVAAKPQKAPEPAVKMEQKPPAPKPQKQEVSDQTPSLPIKETSKPTLIRNLDISKMERCHQEGCNKQGTHRCQIDQTIRCKLEICPIETCGEYYCSRHCETYFQDRTQCRACKEKTGQSQYRTGIFCGFLYFLIMVFAMIFLTQFLLKRRDGVLITDHNDKPSISIMECGKLTTCSEAIWSVDSVTIDSVELLFESVLGDLTDRELAYYFPANTNPETLTDEQLLEGFKRSLFSMSPEELLFLIKTLQASGRLLLTSDQLMQLFTEKILTNPAHINELITYVNAMLDSLLADVKRFEERLSALNALNQTELWSTFATELNQIELKGLSFRISTYTRTNATRAAEVCNTTWLIQSAQQVQNDRSYYQALARFNVSQITIDYNQILTDLILQESQNLTEAQLFTLFLETQSHSEVQLSKLLSKFNFTQLVLTFGFIQESTNADLASLFAQKVLSSLNDTQHRLLTDHYQTQNETYLLEHLALPSVQHTFSKDLGSELFNYTLSQRNLTANYTNLLAHYEQLADQKSLQEWLNTTSGDVVVKVLLFRNLTVEEAYERAKQRYYFEETIGNFTSVELAYARVKAGEDIIEHISKLNETALDAFLDDIRTYGEKEAQVRQTIQKWTTTQLQTAYNLTETTTQEDLIAQVLTLSDEEKETLMVQVLLKNFDTSVSMAALVAGFTADQLATAYDLTGSSTTEDLTFVMEQLSLGEVDELLTEVVKADIQEFFVGGEEEEQTDAAEQADQIEQADQQVSQEQTAHPHHTTEDKADEISEFIANLTEDELQTAYSLSETTNPQSLTSLLDSLSLADYNEFVNAVKQPQQTESQDELLRSLIGGLVAGLPEDLLAKHLEETRTTDLASLTDAYVGLYPQSGLTVSQYVQTLEKYLYN